jgi:hypothetical protein
MGSIDRQRASRATGGQLLARRQWAQATLRQHLSSDGACPACSSGINVVSWPCPPAKTALPYLGGSTRAGQDLASRLSVDLPGTAAAGHSRS